MLRPVLPKLGGTFLPLGSSSLERLLKEEKGSEVRSGLL